ncbi:MAG: asparagine synthase-related protein, partial [Pseudolabrys sp.]
ARAALPIRNATNLGLYSFVHDAMTADGHRIFVAGQYGNYGLTWDGRFSLRALLRGGDWRGFAHELSAVARQTGRSRRATVVSDVVVSGLPAPLLRLAHRLRGREPADVARFSLLNPDFIAGRDLKRQWRAQGFDPWFRASGWDAARYRAYLLFDHNQWARDGKGMYEEHHGLERRDPHADRRLLEFALTVPEQMFRRDGVPRSFARAVLADRLPSIILEEPRRGAHGVAWFRRLNAGRQDIAMEIERLEASPVARRLIDLPRMRRLMEKWPADEHAAERRKEEFKLALTRAVHVGRFIRWAEGGNA